MCVKIYRKHKNIQIYGTVYRKKCVSKYKEYIKNI